MTTRRRPRDEGNAVQYQEPGEKEVPAAPHGEPLFSGNRGPGGKAPGRVARESENAGGGNGDAEEPGDAFGPAGRGIELRVEGKPGAIRIGAVAPIERRMGVEYLEPAAEHQKQKAEVEPVSDADRQPVP